MAVLAIKKIDICAMKKDRKAILEKLQSMGALEIRAGGDETDVFKKIVPNMKNESRIPTKL